MSPGEWPFYGDVEAFQQVRRRSFLYLPVIIFASSSPPPFAARSVPDAIIFFHLGHLSWTVINEGFYSSFPSSLFPLFNPTSKFLLIRGMVDDKILEAIYAR